MANRDLYNLNDVTKGNSKSNDFVAGAIIGGIAGALAALLLAPKSGKELRSNLNEQTNALLSKTEKLRDAAMTRGNDLATAAKDRANTITKTVTQQSADLLNKVKGPRSQQDQQNGAEQEASSGPAGNLQEVPTSMAETSSMEQTHTATGEEIQRKLEETQKAFDETESKINQ
ncbi:YtxH domain-containing protein [Bacillus sp. T33-2]|uniref:YtxH domain-containing protein n=1 Tax=Bacillus sp. T33-2 TaxID=2054168 RepID=UPI000C75968E|nr:YtxH domain-containing protein [Bacillus sp. T33-2]PLR98174.1 YtxH domain-containing protein [Bacillus sp. T33-2]